MNRISSFLTFELQHKRGAIYTCSQDISNATHVTVNITFNFSVAEKVITIYMAVQYPFMVTMGLEPMMAEPMMDAS